MTQQLRVGKQPSSDYIEALKECIREAVMGLHSRSIGQLRKLHQVGIVSETQKVINRKETRQQWKYGHPKDTTINRRLREMANEASFIVFVEPKGCGWYALAESVFEK